MKLVTNRETTKYKSNYRACWLVLLCLTIVGFHSVAIAESDENLAELPDITVQGQWLEPNLTRPVLAKVVAPRGIRHEMAGTKIQMVFKIGEDGKVLRISSDAAFYNENESHLKNSMKNVMRNWKFQPCVSRPNGAPVAIKVAMEVLVIKNSGDNNSSPHAAIGNIKDLPLLAVLD